MNFNKIKLAKNEGLCYTAVTTLQDGENKNHRAQGCAAEMGCKAMIKLRNVHKTFGHLEVLKGIDLEVAKGEKLVIIGPSGSGKSTLIRCMNGLEEVTKGEVYIDGQLMTHKTRAALNRQYSSMVFQQFNLYPHLTVMDNLTLGPVKLKKVRKDEAEALAMENLKRVGLEKKALVYPATLSGGQQQRLCIARALAISPSILLMDEPTSALDPISTSKIEDLIHELKKEYTIVIVTHNMQQAARVSDKTGYFYLGELVEYGETRKIFTNPEKESTQNYITGRFG